MKIYYACNGKKCKKCKKGCQHTDDKRYALNFIKNEDGDYVEDAGYLDEIKSIEQLLKEEKIKKRKSIESVISKRRKVNGWFERYLRIPTDK